MMTDYFKVNRALGELLRARNAFEAQAAYEYLKKVLVFVFA